LAHKPNQAKADTANMISTRQQFLNVAILTFCLTAQQAWAQETSSLQPTTEDLTSVENALAQSKLRQEQLSAAQQAAIRAQEEMSDKLVALALTTSEQEQSLAKAEKRLKKLKTELAKAYLSLATRRNELSKLLAGLQRLQQDPPPALVVSPNDVLQALRGAMMFSAVVPELRAKADSVKADLNTLNNLKASLDTETREHAAALQGLSQSQQQITDLIAQKQAAAEAADKDLAAERKSAEALALKAESLRDLLAKLAEARAKAEAEQAAALAAEQKRQAEEMARLTAEQQKLAAEQAKQLAEAKARAEAAANPPRIAFAKAKGTLQLPVAGTLLKAFGADTGLGHTLPGLALKTEANAQIISPVAGKVEFAGLFRSYGGLVIINPGDGYLVLLAGMDKILTVTGQSIKAGEPLGEMGLKSAELAISNDLTNQNFPVLYVEFRKNTDPIDPSPWWVANYREAMK
jgi:murein hydrolase activator